MKVIRPLFLDPLYQEFEAVRTTPRLLRDFHGKLADLSFLDPACGCTFCQRELKNLRTTAEVFVYVLLSLPGRPYQYFSGMYPFAFQLDNQ